MELYGIHGTTVSCANKIEQDGVDDINTLTKGWVVQST